MARTFAIYWKLPFLNQPAEGGELPWNDFMIDLHERYVAEGELPWNDFMIDLYERYVAELGCELATSDLQ